jgi:hypothetical protein
MRGILIIALVLCGIFVGFVSVMSKTVTHTETNATKNQNDSGMTGLYVAHPNNMKNFPVELVPLP